MEEGQAAAAAADGAVDKSVFVVHGDASFLSDPPMKPDHAPSVSRHKLDAFPK